MKIYRNIISLNGVRIFYFDTKTNGPAILCLHGRWGRGETWIDFMLHYGDKYRIIAPDQRGHGFSDKPVGKYTPEEMTSDMIALINYLDLGSVIIFGHSMGGYNAGYMAAFYPNYVSAVAILDKSANGPEEENSADLKTLEINDPITKDWPLPFTSLRQAQEYIHRDNESELSYQYFLNSLHETIEGYTMMFSTQAMSANIAYYHQWFNLLPQIKCPVLLIRSSSHEAVSDEDLQKMQALLSNSMVFEMSKSDHNVHLSNPKEFYDYCDIFLEKINSSSSLAQKQ